MDEEATSQTQLNDPLGKQLLKSQQISCMRKEKKMGEEMIVTEYFLKNVREIKTECNV